jgi:hypothetical protein
MAAINFDSQGDATRVEFGTMMRRPQYKQHMGNREK